jgi:nucleotide-binding universal stress UspA family protein
LHSSFRCVDDSDFANGVLRQALMWKRENDILYIVHALETVKPSLFQGNVDIINQRNQDKAKAICERIYSLCQERQISNAIPLVLSARYSSAKEMVIKFAAKRNIDTIVVGSRGHGAVKRVILGSFSNYLVNCAPCNVLVIRPARTHKMSKICYLLRYVTRSLIKRIRKRSWKKRNLLVKTRNELSSNLSIVLLNNIII